MKIQTGYEVATAFVTEVPVRAIYWWDNFPDSEDRLLWGGSARERFSRLNYAFGFKYPGDPSPTYSKFLYNGAPQISLILPPPSEKVFLFLDCSIFLFLCGWQHWLGCVSYSASYSQCCSLQ
jgi:hypothetical protein